MLKYLLFCLVLLNVLDALITNHLFSTDIATEGNPLLLPLVGQPVFIAVKVLGVLFAAFVLWDIGRRHHRGAQAAAGVFVLVYAVIVGWNTSLLV